MCVNQNFFIETVFMGRERRMTQQKDNTMGILLLAGGGFSSWIWRDLIDKLTLPVLALDKRLAINTEETRKNSTIEDCLSYALDEINAHHFKELVIVAHSGAGIIALNMAKKLQHRIKGIIFVSANIPKDGQCALDMLPSIIKWINKTAIRNQAKNNSTPLIKFEKIARRNYCNTCSEAIIQYMLSQQFMSEPLCVAFEKNNWQGVPDIPMMYTLLTEDKTINVKGQKKMMANLNIKNSVEIDADHMVMLSQPDKLASSINQFVDQLEG